MNATMCLFMFVSLIFSGVALAGDDIYNLMIKADKTQDKIQE